MLLNVSLTNYRDFWRPLFQIVNVLHDVPEGREIIVTLVAVHAVVHGDESDVVVREIGVGVAWMMGVFAS